MFSLEKQLSNNHKNNYQFFSNLHKSPIGVIFSLTGWGNTTENELFVDFISVIWAPGHSLPGLISDHPPCGIGRNKLFEPMR